ncbi:DMT family transporter [Rhodoferax bucti]|uniref:DMT family transporter n=1 Tax=Rhodoferax bucti TaxID=2576305 RepID=UPI0011096F89|nr:EamA family transporter [Rhodoferax bucti]
MADHTPAQVLRGIGLAIVAMACFATLDTTTKWVSLSAPLMVAMFFRYGFQAVATTLIELPRQGRALVQTQHLGLHLLRGGLLLTTSVFAYLSLKHMPVGEFTAIVLLTPLVVTLLAARMLHEKVSRLRLLLVAGGFLGTLIIVRPEGSDVNWALLFPIGVVLANAGFQLLTSRMTRTEDPMTMQFYTGWTGAVVAAVALPFVWVPIASHAVWGGLALMGFLGSLGHFIFIQAFKRAPAAVLMPYMYAQIAFAMLGGWIIFSHMPDQWTLAGMALIAVCGAAGAWLTAHESRAAAETPEH